MHHYRTVLIIGIAEIVIGSVTVLFNLMAWSLAASTKSPNVLIFVVTTGIISILIGFGVLNFKKLAYQLLLYFSSVIILSKLLIFAGILQLNGALETTIPAPLKNMVSIVYHGFVIVYLSKRGIKEIYHR